MKVLVFYTVVLFFSTLFAQGYYNPCPDTTISGEDWYIKSEYFPYYNGKGGNFWRTEIWASQKTKLTDPKSKYIDESYWPEQTCIIYSLQPFYHVVQSCSLIADFNYLYKMRLEDQYLLGQESPSKNQKIRWFVYGTAVTTVLYIAYGLISGSAR